MQKIQENWLSKFKWKKSGNCKKLGIHRIAEISSHAVESVKDLESLSENEQEDIACSKTIYRST